MRDLGYRYPQHPSPLWSVMAAFALVDCNNFYVSCERLFQPGLRGRPVVVASNNDGCVISRSQEAKALGIAMGVPLFQIKDMIRRHDIVVRSSNYALYGDLSDRVMRVLAAHAPRHEVYSIDECFLDVDHLAVSDLSVWCHALRVEVLRWTGIPVSIGVGRTKTLAKMANKLAKGAPRTNGVLDLATRPTWIAAALRQVPAGDVWGIGRRWSKMLAAHDILTAHDLAHAPDDWLRRRMGVVGLRTSHELRGRVCHSLEDQPKPRQTSCCARSFGTAIRDKAQVHDAISSFAQRAAEKIRQAGQVAGVIQLFMRTDPFDPTAPQKSVTGSAVLERPSADGRAIVGAATRIFEKLWCEGYGWRKAGVLLLDLGPPGRGGATLFDPAPPLDDGLMAAIDQINARFGRGSAGLGVTQSDSPWRGRRSNLSPHFTTRWSDIATARAGGD